MVDWIVYLWQFPYFRWHVFFTFFPIVLLWAIWGKYLFRYKKTFIYAIAVSLLYGTPADLLAVHVFHLWGYEHTKHIGSFIFGLPLGEYVFIVGFSVFAVSLLLVLRGKIYKKYI